MHYRISFSGRGRLEILLPLGHLPVQCGITGLAWPEGGFLKVCASFHSFREAYRFVLYSILVVSLPSAPAVACMVL